MKDTRPIAQQVAELTDVWRMLRFRKFMTIRKEYLAVTKAKHKTIWLDMDDVCQEAAQIIKARNS